MIRERVSSFEVTNARSYKTESKQANGTWKVTAGPFNSSVQVPAIQIDRIEWDGSRRSGPIKRTRACEHTIIRDHPCKPKDWYAYGDVARTSRTSYNSWVPTNLFVPPIAVPSYSLNVHLQDALDFIGAGCVNQEIDLVTNITELPSLKSLCSSLATRLKNAKVAFPKLKTLAGDHLAYSFGIKPLISDVKALVNTVSYMKDHVAWLRRNQGKIVPVRYNVDLSDDYRPSDFQVSKNTTYHTECIYRQFKAVLSCHALVTYEVSAIRDAELQLRALARRFGVDNPLAIIWENVPFSFVLDWVVDIGGFLGALAPKISVPTKYLDCGHSVKTVIERDVIFDAYPAMAGSGLPIRVQRQVLHHYKRVPGIPLSYGAMNLTVPSTNQLVLGLSLAVQKFSK